VDPLVQIKAPVSIGLFAGALDYRTVNVLPRWHFRAMRVPEGDWRNWTEIRSWVAELVARFKQEAPTMTTVVVPLDGSELADRALPFATTIAARGGRSVLLLRVVDTMSAPSEADEAVLKREAQAALDATAASLSGDGVSVTTRVVEGQAETAILAASGDEDVSLIVMSTHGRGGLGRFVYGSVADTVLRHAPVPVLTVPPHVHMGWQGDTPVKVLVPLDGSALSRAALGPARELADLLGGPLLLASVAELPRYTTYTDAATFVVPDVEESVLEETRRELEALAAELRTDARQVETHATFGSPYFDIARIARDARAGLIVMATRGRSGLTRAILGSVATATLSRSEIPVMLVCPDEDEASA
jgi:nucleotide-binding universal stress UspA family protein